VVHLVPRADWAADTDYTVTLLPGVIVTLEGATTAAPYTFSFSTRAPPVADEDEPLAEKHGCDAVPGGVGLGGLGGVLILAAVRRRRAIG
jgi:uncharacterized protein (TIGR03382 family)